MPVQPAVAERKAAQRSAAQSCCSSPDSESSTHIHTHTCTQCAVSLCRCWRRSQRWPCVLKCALGFLRTKNWSTAPNTHTHTQKQTRTRRQTTRPARPKSSRSRHTHRHKQRDSHTLALTRLSLPLLCSRQAQQVVAAAFVLLNSLALSLCLSLLNTRTLFARGVARLFSQQLKVYWMNEWVSTKRAELSRDLSWVL